MVYPICLTMKALSDNSSHAEYFLCATLLPKFYPVNLQHSTCKHVFSIIVENSVDHDQIASSEAS